MMMRKKSTRTKYPGVYTLSRGRYRIRAKVRNPRTGRSIEIDREVKVRSARDASRIREELREIARRDESPREPKRVRVGDYARRWASRKKPELAHSTRERYAAALEHVCEQLGDIYVDRLNADDITRWRDRQRDAPETINGRLRVLKTMMRAATHELGLPRNPAEMVRTIRATGVEDAETNMLSSEELAEVLAFIEHDRPRWHALFVAAAFTGARFGELSALRWEDIDHERGEVHIRRAQVRGKVGNTKTKKRRKVAMTPVLADALRRHRRRLLEEQAPGLDAGWVFPNTKGGLMRNSSPTKALKAALAAAGVERRVTFHGLRRTFNNLARQAASGQVVRAITGHVTERMTEHYSDVGLDEKRQVADAIVALLQPSPRKSGDAGGDALRTNENGR